MTVDGEVERPGLSPPSDPPAPSGARPGRARLLRRLSAVAVLAVAGAVGAALLYSYPGRLGPDPTFFSPHENVRFHLAVEWVEHGRPERELPAAARLPPDISPALTPRDAGRLEGRVVPKDYPYALALVALLTGIDPRLAVQLAAVSAVGVVLVTALLAWELTGSALAALLAAVLLAASRSLVASAAGLLETGATTALAVLTGLLLLLRGRRARSGLWLEGVAGLCFGVAVGLHYGAALLVGPAMLVLALPAFGGGWRRWLALGAGFAAGVAPIFALHAWLYGGPLATGYSSVGSRFFDENFQVHAADLFDLRPRLLARQVRFYWFRPEVLVLLAGAAAGLVAGGWRRRPYLALVLIGILGGGPYLAFTGARPLWGSSGFEFNASFMRYGLPVLAMAVVLAVAAAVRLRRPAALVLACLVAAAAVAVGGHAGLVGVRTLRESVQQAAAARQAVVAATGPQALIVTARGDKWAWPDRATVTAAYLVRTPAQGRFGDHLYDTVPNRERLADVLVRLVAQGKEVYLWNDGWLRLPDPRLDAICRRQGVYRHRTPVPALFRYSTIPPAPGERQRVVSSR